MFRPEFIQSLRSVLRNRRQDRTLSWHASGSSFTKRRKTTFPPPVRGKWVSRNERRKNYCPLSLSLSCVCATHIVGGLTPPRHIVRPLRTSRFCRIYHSATISFRAIVSAGRETRRGNSSRGISGSLLASSVSQREREREGSIIS